MAPPVPDVPDVGVAVGVALVVLLEQAPMTAIRASGAANSTGRFNNDLIACPLSWPALRLLRIDEGGSYGARAASVRRRSCARCRAWIRPRMRPRPSAAFGTMT